MKILQLLHDNEARERRPVNLVRNEAEATLYIYDIISPEWGVNVACVIDALTQAADAAVMHVRINSPGGDVFESRAIIEAIKRFAGKTIAHIDSLAASCASSIALACDEVEISDGGFLMIHNASGIAWGDKTALRERANLLEKVEGVIAAEYVAETGQDLAQITAWMEAETWFTAAEAIEAGFADRLSATATKVKNTWNLAAFDKTPQALKSPVAAPEPVPAPRPDPVSPVDQNPSMTVANTNRLRLLELV